MLFVATLMATMATSAATMATLFATMATVFATTLTVEISQSALCVMAHWTARRPSAAAKSPAATPTAFWTPSFSLNWRYGTREHRS